MLINELHISCLQLLGLIERAKLTYPQRQQLSSILISELLPLTLAWWNLPLARRRLMLNQVDQLKADLNRLPQKHGLFIDARAANYHPRAARHM